MERPGVLPRERAGGVGVSGSTSEPLLAERVLEAISAAVVVADREGIIVYANRAAVSALGDGCTSIVGQELDDALGAGSELRRLVRTAPLAGESRHEVHFAPRRGAAFDAGLTLIRPERAQCPEVGTIVLFRDLDQLGAIEAEMRRTERLGALGRVVGGLAHELRNPLAAVQALAETLNLEIEPGDSRREYADRITAAVRRINDFVTAAVAFADPAVPAIGRQRLVGLVDSALRRASTAGHAVSLAAPSPALAQVAVAVDAGQIGGCLDALLANAREATGPSGRIEVELGSDGRRSGRQWFRVEVRDDGPGVGQADIARIFEPYFTTKPGSMGMGLAVAHSLARLNGGTVELRRSTPAGSCFALALPEAPE